MTDKIVDLKDAKRKQKGGKRDASRAELADRLQTLNNEFALVLVGDKAVVLHDTTDSENRPVTNFLLVTTFRTWLETNRVFDGEDERFVDIGKIWLKSPLRRQYRGVTFSPEGDIPGFYNLWRGFALEPAPPYADRRNHIKHFAAFYDHVYRNIAKGDPKLRDYVFAWAADLVQRPTKKPGVALVLRGKKGCGKTVVGETFGSLLGRHWALVDTPDHLTGKFNAHMWECLLLQADEAIWAGDKVAEGRLKGLITSAVQMVERKGIDPIQLRNLVHVILTSNSDWVVPASFDERRFAVFDVGDGNRSDREFFGRLKAELDAGGRQHLLAWLMSFDLDSVDVATAPATEALLEQKIATMDDVHNWWHGILYDGRLLAPHSSWFGEVSRRALHASYLAFAEKLSKGRKLSPEQLGLALRQMLPRQWDSRGVKVKVPIALPDGTTVDKWVNGYRFPPLSECRGHFDELIGHPIAWPSDETEPQSGSATRPDTNPHDDNDGFELDDP